MNTNKLIKFSGFILAKAGYDIWLGNIRGTYYARKHVTLIPELKQFWNFRYYDASVSFIVTAFAFSLRSFHEIGVYDIPAQLDLVKNVTGTKNITYIGHSMGSTAGFVYASLKPDHAKDSTILFILMAPTALFANFAPVRAAYIHLSFALTKVKQKNFVWIYVTITSEHFSFSLKL